jgi:mRNA interferase RelE/StbE
VASYSVTFARSARKELQALERPLALRILSAVESLADDPRPSGCRKIRGSKALWRIRIGDYRVVYSVDDTREVVDIVAVRHRGDAYR